jgi:hypothetical protein
MLDLGKIKEGIDLSLQEMNQEQEFINGLMELIDGEQE